MIYLDNAATTQCKSEVVDSMLPFFIEQFGNPSSTYDYANTAKMATVKARNTIADTLRCSPEEIYFTSGGSEADNWALRSIIGSGKRHIITSKIEHSAVLNTCKYLQTLGYDVSYINVNKDGLVDLEELESNIRDDTYMISIMTVNNEIGTIQPITEIGEIARRHDVLFHTDAVQAYGHIPISLKNIDMMSVSGHKFGAPKGIGFLYCRNGVKLKPLIYGGHQESGLRAGTENVTGIIGMGVAVSIAYKKMAYNVLRITAVTDYFKKKLVELGGVVNGGELRVPGNINVRFGVDGMALMTLLNEHGICCSTGSACNSGSGEPSHVLKAIGLSNEECEQSVRFSLSDGNTKEEIDYVVEKLSEILTMLK